MYYFTFMWPCIVTIFFIIKPTICINFPNLLRHETLHVSGSSSAYHQEFIHYTLGTGICHTGMRKAFEQDQDGTSSILVLSVQWINSWWWAEELPETCRVSCRSKLGKLMHLVGFIRKKFVTMHCHMNVKKKLSLQFRVLECLWWSSLVAIHCQQADTRMYRYNYTYSNCCRGSVILFMFPNRR
jgi:hypothetical protein